jgi:two-component system, chemotaxis family, protein-glutamate methylesterase/glutaminase
MKDMTPIYVVVIDNSPAERDLLVAVLEAAPGLQVIGAGADGEEALRLVKRLKPDVVILDARLPKLDGLEVTRRIMREMPTRIVIVVNDVLHTDTDLSFDALRAGALTVVLKPKSNVGEVAKELIQTIRLMAGVSVIHHWGRTASRAIPRVTKPVSSPLRSKSEAKIVGIASSTGGPTALAAVLGGLPRLFPLPILVVQHITTGFSEGLVQWLATQTDLTVRVAREGEKPSAGAVLVAPDDKHMVINGAGVVELNRAQPYKGLRPSANPLFFSLAEVYGAAAIGIILTGMGDDGVDGLEALHKRGGVVLAQDEPTSVIYGMPQQAVLRGVVDDVLSLDHIGLALAGWQNPEQMRVR